MCRQHAVDKRCAEVDAPARGAQHPLHKFGDLVRGEDERGQLGAAAAGHEYPPRLVDPDLLDGGVVQEWLQRSEPGDGVQYCPGHGGGVTQWR
jgi:hypothetical protein